MTDLDRIILNFLNENKLYPTNIVNNLTKKLGDNSQDTINKLAIFGLFRQAPPFNTIKDINQLNSLDELTKLFDEWKEYALQQLVGSRGELKGNKTASMTYLDAYINNIASLGNNAKPFSFKGYEQSLIAVCKKNEWIKQNDVATQTYGVEKPHDSDIMFEDDNILILKGSTKAKCISYGQGYTWCISQTKLNAFNSYRIEDGATIYFVLNKKLPKDDVERVCVILRYSGNKYSIADESNFGQRSGGLSVAGKGFEYVESQLPWLRGMGQYFSESKVTKSEKEYAKITDQKYAGNDLGDYIIRKSKELKFNGDDIDPIDLLRDYVNNNTITLEQFKSLTEPMKVQLIEIDYSLDDEMIKLLDTGLKVRYAVRTLKYYRDDNINFGLYSEEEINRVIENIKDVINNRNIYIILSNIPSDDIRYMFLKKLFPFIPFDENDVFFEMYNSISDLFNTIYQYNINIYLINTLDKNILIYLSSSFLARDTPENNFQITKLLFPLIKDNLTPEIFDNIFEGIGDNEQIDLLIPQIIPLIIDKLDNDLIKVILDWTDDVDKPKINRLIKQYRKQQPVNENKQKDVVNKLRLLVRNILKENY